jgi:hypothetical protein
MVQQPLGGQCLLIIEASRLHSRHTTLGRTPLYEWSARRRELFLTTHTNENGVPVSERQQAHDLDELKDLAYVNK